MDRKLLNKVTASMLAVILVLTNNNVTLFAEDISIETESILAESNQEIALDTSQEIPAEEPQEDTGEETLAEEPEAPAEEPEAPAENQPAEVPETPAEEQPAETPETSAENQPTEATETPAENQPTKTTETSAENQSTEATETSAENQPTEATETSAENQPTEVPETSAEEQTEISTEETSEEETEDESEEGEAVELYSENAKTISTAQDLVALSKESADIYQNAKIVIAPHDTTGLDLSGTEFQGLGSDERPFKGSIGFSGEYTGYITLDKSLFNAISEDAQITSTLNLKAANDMTDPILAKKYIAGSDSESNSQVINLKIDAKSTDTTEDGEQTSYSSFGGIIGTLGENATVLLNITNVIPASKTAVKGDGNRGFFCNTLEAKASLTISAFSGNADFQITSTDGNAGALVGHMGTGAKLIVTSEISFSGSVNGKQNVGGLVGKVEDEAKLTLSENYTVSGSISSENGNVGGLIGSVVNNPVTVADGKKVSVQENAALSANGTSGAAGGLFGSSTISQNMTLDLSAYTVSGVTMTSGQYAGGLFGVLKNGSEGATENHAITITSGTDENKVDVSSSASGVGNYGGLIGKYEANQLASSLDLHDLQITSIHSGNARSSYSGVIAEVAGKSYVKVNDLTVSADQNATNCVYFGGITAKTADKASGFFDIKNVKISGNSNSNNKVIADGASGGLIGKMGDGVLRLSGKTDLSGIQPGEENSRYGQLVGSRDAALIYAVETGSNYDSTNGTGWTLVRDGSDKCVSDIGNWGEVIRLDGSKLKENSVSDQTAADALFKFDETNHTVTVNNFKCSDISTAQDFAALALTMQCNGADTEGALRFSGSADLTSQITLAGNIDLTDTGVTGFMRDDGTQENFTGKLDGGSYTLTLDIGDAYGVKSDGSVCTSETAGCGQIYHHFYLGLFAKTGNLAGDISNLTVTGSIQYGLSSQNETWVGGVTAYQDAGTASYQKVTSNVTVSVTNGDSTKAFKATHVGGFVGAASGSPELSFNGCGWTGTIQDSADTASEVYLGGYIGSMSPDGGSITLTASSIGKETDNKAAAISVKQPGTVSRTGGILAAVETKKDTDNKITITANGFTVDGFDSTSVATESTGGFLGYDWHNVDVTVSGLSVSNATLTAKNAGFGGLVYEAAGHWIVKTPDESQDADQATEAYGIKYGADVSFNGKSADDTPSALLVCRGDDYRSTEDTEDNYALYLELDSKAAYQADPSVLVTLNSGTYFDELVGISMGTHGNGIVSIATENHEKLNQKTCNTYQKKLAKDYDNPHTRYYYNLDQYQYNYKAEGDIESGEELLMWTLGQYAEWNIKDYFRVYDDKPGEATYTKNREVKGNIDLTGLSYYPIDYTGKMNITDAKIIFDYAQINTCETNNKPLNNADKQHYMMQTGLFRDLTSQEKYAAQIVLTNSTLSGSIGQTAEGVSGALVVGTMEGKVTQNVLYPATIQINGLTLNGIYVDGVENDDYAPLLVNAASRNSTLNIKNVTTSEQYRKDCRTQAATSLFGEIGNETAINMSVSFQNMKLDARTESGKSDAMLYNTMQSIFTKATFLHSFQYDPKDAASSGSYTFTKDDTVKRNDNSWGGNVTYGLEISNTASGRNQGQQYYYLGDINNPEYVQDAILNTTSENSTDSACFANGKYLRYVALKEGNDSKEHYHEIDINLQSADILAGCGTYDDPFQITSGAQLGAVARFIATGKSNGWNVNLPKTVIKNKNSLSAHDTTENGHYQYKSGSDKWKAAEDTEGLSAADVRTYMRNAYYQIENDIELSSSFYGLGGPLPQESTFSGVIVGKKKGDSCPIVYITAQGTTNTFGGLIAFSQGSVVKDLVLEFGGTTVSSGQTEANVQSDNNGAPESYAPMSITIESQKPGQDRKQQSFFGGVMGYVVGGDNIIDNVTLKNLTANQIKVEGEYAKIADIGGYVGLVGGNLESGGGVIFRNISGSGLSDYKDENSEFYYRNPFVGRVLDGYACSENCGLENTDKNYRIHQLIETDKLKVDAKEITIGSAQQLWVLSAIVNSGAGGGDGTDEAIKYNSDAYNYGRSRTGTYGNVGESVSSDSGAAEDNTHWGGELTGQVSYLVQKYADLTEAAKISSALSSAHRLIFTADCDMTAYGNGFRGIGTTYQDNQLEDTYYDANGRLKTGIRNRTLWITGTVGCEDDSNPLRITLARNVKEYVSEGKDGWWAQGIGLFPVVNFSAKTEVKNLIIAGTSSISYFEVEKKESNYIGEASAGGFAGMTANESGNNNVTFKNVQANNLTVTGSKYSGGFFGVIGKSSRTNASGLTEVSSVVGTYTFTSCSYNGITVEGGYSAGGFVGTYRNDGKGMTVSGKTKLSGSNIGWIKDACLDMYTVDKSEAAKDNAKMNGYSGGGGIVGYYYGGDMNVAKIEKENIILNGLYIYGPQFAYNCDYGLGGIVGLYASAANLTIKNIEIYDTAVEVQINPKYKGEHLNNTGYYTTPACGLLLGYSTNNKFKQIIIDQAEIENGYVLNAGYCGGLMGRPGLKTSISNTEIKNLTVYSRGAASYTGSARAGGLIASNGIGSIDITNVAMENVTVVSDGNTALIQGLLYNATTQTVNNLKTQTCVVATIQKPEVKGRYFNEKDTDPGSSGAATTLDSYAGTAGLFIGASKLNAKSLNVTDCLYAFNIGVKDLTLGYYCGEELTYQYNKDNYSGTFSAALDDTTIGAYDAKGGTSYADMEMSDENRYTGGYLGLITGANRDTDTSTVKIIGFSIQGGNYPYELSGNGDATFVRKSVDNKTGSVTYGGAQGNNYVIFSDYSGDSFDTEKCNKDGTKGALTSNYPANTPAADSPYVTINGTSSLKVYSSDNDTIGMKLTSDGMDGDAKRAIVSDLTQGTGSKIYQQKYQRVKYAKANEVNGTITYTLANAAEKFDPANGEYKERLSTYFTASESNRASYAGIDDFDVLVIDITESSEITKMVREYISVLTNCDQTGTQEKSDKAQYTSVNAYTYQWKGTKFVKQPTSSLIINSSDKSVSVRAGAHDNQSDQFTVLDVFYANPGNTNEGYHLFIPVVVRKILQTEFSIKMRTGSSTYDAAYTTNAAMLANYGEQFTAQLTYSYIWTADEWNANIAAGTSFLWSYDKQVKLGDAKGSLVNPSTRYTLVDMNRRGAGTTFFTGNGAALTNTEGKQDAILKFNALNDCSSQNYSSVYLSDLLPLTAEPEQNGDLKVVSSEKATIRIWDSAKSEYVYYGPKGSKDPTNTPYYKVTVGKTGSEEVKVSEVYYLTVNCQDGDGVITQNASLGLDRMTSTNSSALPSRKRGSDTQNTYTLGKFYNVTDVTITPEGEDNTGAIKSETNDYIDLGLNAKVTVPEAYRTQFDSYAKNDPVYFRFAVQMHNQSQDDTGSDQILTNAVQALSVKLGDKELSSQDYTCEVSDGVLYLLVKNKTGSDFSGTAIAATLRLSYSGSEMDAQFPMRKGMDETSGITFSVNAAIAYSENSLDGSTMSKSESSNMKFYRETISSVGITYRAYDTVSEDGNVSQLGINGKEVANKGGVTITTQGIYNATDMSGLNTTDEDNDAYPYYLVGSLELQKKTTDSNGNTAYRTVKMSDYITSVSVNKGAAEEPGNRYTFEMQLTEDQVRNLATEPITVDVSYFVKSDKQLEELGDQAQYANYKVILTAHLANKSETALIEDVSDYIIYTNAKFYNGIISTRDFDGNSEQ